MEVKDLSIDDMKNLLLKQDAKIQEIEKQLKNHLPEEKMSMIVFSNDFDKAIAAFIIASGAATMGMEVHMFFTFWATSILRDPKRKVKGKKVIEKMFEIMLPNGSEELSLSKMNMMGMGTKMMKQIMKNQNVASLEELIMLVREMDIKIHICDMSMSLMGLRKEELLFGDVCDVCGIAAYLSYARKSKISLFI